MKLVQPKIDELTAMDKIVDELRPELLTGLSLQVVENIEDLCELSTRLEDSHRSVEERQRRPQPKQQRLATSEEGPKPKGKQPEVLIQPAKTGGERPRPQPSADATANVSNDRQASRVVLPL